MTDNPRIIPTQSVQQAAKAQRQQAVKKMAYRNMARTSAIRSFLEFCESGFNPVTISRKFKTLEEIKAKKTKTSESEKEEDEDIIILELEKAQDAATKFHERNPELQKNSLLLLKQSIKQTDSAEEILKKVMDFYPDKTLADEALDFLYETSSGELKQQIRLAKKQLNQDFRREIKAGKNIQKQALEFAKTGLGSPTALRDLYRNITGNIREPTVLFKELSELFSFTKLKSILKFLFHSLGADLKAKGPSINSAELLKLVTDVKSLQAVLGVYLFFQERINLINSQILNYDLQIPPNLTFEMLAKQFIKLLSEKFISPEKVLKLANFFGISEETLIQIILFNQLRDATRNTSPRLYKSNKHRQDVLDSILEALDELEERLEEEEENDDK